MDTSFYGTGTEWVFTKVTIDRGSVSDIETVGMLASADPNVRPAVADFTAATLVDGTAVPAGPLAIPGRIDIAARIGARSDVASALQLTAGDYQMFTLITTADEDVIDVAGTITIL
jgi:hypothetical protein